MAVSIVPLDHSHLVAFYGDKGRGPTVKGVAAFVDGRLVAVGGLAIVSGKVVAFCDLKPEARPFKAAIHRTALRVLDQARRHHRRIVAICDETEPGAPKWLAKLGFRENHEGEWEWRH